MTAAELAAALGGRRSGKGWMACCPAHSDRNASLSIGEGDRCPILLKCFAGCSYDEIVDALERRGIFLSSRGTPSPIRNIRPRAAVVTAPPPTAAKALEILKQTIPAEGTLVQSYLRNRGITGPIPSDLRFHPRLKHTEGGLHPAMVAIVRDGRSGDPVAIHRTYLARDGLSKAHVTPQKMMLGPTAGGAVMLGAPTHELLIAEGIETALSVLQATGKPICAALSTSGLCALVLPPSVTRIVILADADEPGKRAAEYAAYRWTKEGRTVRIASPPLGSDFNDMLRGNTPHHTPMPERNVDDDER